MCNICEYIHYFIPYSSTFTSIWDSASLVMAVMLMRLSIHVYVCLLYNDEFYLPYTSCIKKFNVPQIENTVYYAYLLFLVIFRTKALCIYFFFLIYSTFTLKIPLYLHFLLQYIFQLKFILYSGKLNTPQDFVHKVFLLQYFFAFKENYAYSEKKCATLLENDFLKIEHQENIQCCRWNTKWILYCRFFFLIRFVRITNQACICTLCAI